MWLLLLTNLSHVLLLSFVLFESFFRLISCQLGVRCPFWQICGLTGCLDLLFTNILLLSFHLGRVLGATPVDIVFVLTTSHHDHAGLVWNWSTWGLAACGRIILLSIVSRELVFILQEWVLTYVVLLGLLRKLLTDRSHHAGIFAGRCVNFINFLFSHWLDQHIYSNWQQRFSTFSLNLHICHFYKQLSNLFSAVVLFHVNQLWF